MSRELVSFRFSQDDAIREELWVHKTFPGFWNGRSDHGKYLIITLALEAEDAMLVRLSKNVCQTPIVWQNALESDAVLFPFPVDAGQ